MLNLRWIKPGLSFGRSPMTTARKDYPTRIVCQFKKKKAHIAGIVSLYYRHGYNGVSTLSWENDKKADTSCVAIPWASMRQECMNHNMIYQYPGGSFLDHINILLQKYRILLYSCMKLWGFQSFKRHIIEHKYHAKLICTPDIRLTVQ
jgi:hypothetical protein